MLAHMATTKVMATEKKARISRSPMNGKSLFRLVNKARQSKRTPQRIRPHKTTTGNIRPSCGVPSSACIIKAENRKGQYLSLCQRCALSLCCLRACGLFLCFFLTGLIFFICAVKQRKNSQSDKHKALWA